MESGYKVSFTEGGARRFRKLDGALAKKILSKVGVLKNYKNLNNVKQLKGEKRDYFRLRVGDLRVIFYVEEVAKMVWIDDIGFSGSFYK